MHVVTARNVHEALPKGLELLNRIGRKRDSRNGPVVVAPCPVATWYTRPRERVLFWPLRDANPFFHLFESLWMLDGRNDVDYLTQFVARMREFSDDGETFHGAYGHRWRYYFETITKTNADGTHEVSPIDQVHTIINMLKRNPEERRCVLQIWDACEDLGRGGKDLPCNTQVYFSRGDDGRLNMTVCNRSNDIIWGAYGANAVHFSVLQEYVAAGIGCEVGNYWQMSNNFHAYTSTMDPLRPLLDEAPDPFRTVDRNPYATTPLIEPYPLVSLPIDQWRGELRMFLEEGPVMGLRDPFFRRVAAPMWNAHRAYKELDAPERYKQAHKILEGCEAKDWRVAAQQWIERRHAKWRSG